MSVSLIEVLDLETLDTDLFRGRSPETEFQRVFGGQVAGQALVAAGRTVDADRPVHSLHAYFVHPGDPEWPIIYDVERVRDGRSFTTRRVVARQHGRDIFLLSASFHRPEDGYEHALAAPTVPAPEELFESAADDDVSRWVSEFSSIDLLRIPRDDAADGSGGAPPTGRRAWLRTQEQLPDDPLLHVCVAAYASDLTLLPTALLPHGRRHHEVQLASLDHAMWFHRRFRADEWFLYDMRSPTTMGGRGLTTGQMFSRGGDLLVSVVQEGLMRPRRQGR